MKTTKVRLMDCAQVIPGFSTQGALKDEPEGFYQVVTGRHLTRGAPYVYHEEDRLRIASDRDLSRYFLARGDILYVSRGGNTYPVLIESVPDNTVAPATFFILTPRPGIMPEYLVWCLEQSQTEELIKAMRTGAGTPTIPRKGFMEIPVPLPDTATQRRIADLWRLQYRERQLHRQLLEESGKLQRIIGRNLYHKISTGLNDL